ncbi:hypothetical protein Bca101_058201 [Brassica carinata]
MLTSLFALCCLLSSRLFSPLLSLPDRISLRHSETLIGFVCRLDSTGTDSFSGDSRKTRATINTSHCNFPSRLCLPSCSRSVLSKRRSHSPASRLAIPSVDSSSVSGPLVSTALYMRDFNVSDHIAPGGVFLSATSRSGLEEEDIRPNFQWVLPMDFPQDVSPISSPINFSLLFKVCPNVKNEDMLQITMVLGDWSFLAEILFGFTRFSGSGITRLYLSSGMHLPFGSPGSVLFRSSSSFEEKLLPLQPLPMGRDVSSTLWSSVCFSIFIGLLSCGMVSMGPEDAIEITSVVLVDEIWTSTSRYVIIFQLSDFVVKASSTHSSIVLNPLSSSVEDLSCLAYLCFVCYVYWQRGWIIPFFYCIEED